MTATAPAARERCRNCGAEFKDLVCEYCGLASRRAEGPALERAALDEFHVLVRRCEPDAQEKLLRAGFLPSLQDNLLEAAVQCLPYLDRDNLEPGPGAAVRLESILAKLAALAPPDENVARAIANYRTRLDEHRRADRRSTTLAFALFALLGVAIVAAIVWLVVRLT